METIKVKYLSEDVAPLEYVDGSPTGSTCAPPRR